MIISPNDVVSRSIRWLCPCPSDSVPSRCAVSEASMNYAHHCPSRDQPIVAASFFRNDMAVFVCVRRKFRDRFWYRNLHSYYQTLEVCCHTTNMLHRLVEWSVEYAAPLTFFNHKLLSKSPHDAPSCCKRTMTWKGGKFSSLQKGCKLAIILGLPGATVKPNGSYWSQLGDTRGYYVIDVEGMVFDFYYLG